MTRHRTQVLVYAGVVSAGVLTIVALVRAGDAWFRSAGAPTGPAPGAAAGTFILQLLVIVAAYGAHYDPHDLATRRRQPARSQPSKPRRGRRPRRVRVSR